MEFNKHSVAFYFAGWKSDTGYDAAIEGVQIRGGVMEVQVLVTTKGGCVARNRWLHISEHY